MTAVQRRAAPSTRGRPCTRSSRRSRRRLGRTGSRCVIGAFRAGLSLLCPRIGHPPAGSVSPSLPEGARHDDPPRARRRMAAVATTAGGCVADVTAGIAVTALIVPKNLGYAGIAGVPLQNGLYAAAAGAIIYALFCTSRHISTGPSSSLAAVAGGAVLATGLGGADAAQLVAAIAMATGVLFLLFAVFRLGWIARFLSKAVVTGFLAGAAVDVVIGELPKLTGTSVGGQQRVARARDVARALGDVDWTTVLVGRRRARRDPRAAVRCARGPGRAGARGRRAARLVAVRPRSPRRRARRRRAARAARARAARPRRSSATTTRRSPSRPVALLLIGFSQTAGDARAFAARHRYRIDVNQESVAQGMANVGAGVFQGMPVSTSLSASSLNESAGARTPVASLVTGGARAGDAALPRAALLGPPEGGPRRRDHRRGRLRDDRRRRSCAACTG